MPASVVTSITPNARSRVVRIALEKGSFTGYTGEYVFMSTIFISMHSRVYERGGLCHFHFCASGSAVRHDKAGPDWPVRTASYPSWLLPYATLPGGACHSECSERVGRPWQRASC